MRLRVFLAIPQKNKELEQLRCILRKETADLYVFLRDFYMITAFRTPYPFFPR